MAVTMIRLQTYIRGVIIMAPWVVWLFIADLIACITLILSPFFPDAMNDLASSLAEPGWVWLQMIFTDINGGIITFSGDLLPQEETAIVVSNHVGWSDFYMIQALAMEAFMLGRCRYFMKAQLRWVPLLGWGLWGMGMPMVSRHWGKDKKEMDRMFSGIVDRKWPTCLLTVSQGLVSYSEATRFTPEKYAESAVWCARNGREQPRHLLYPRTKGFVATVQHLRKAKNVKAVYDITIAYQHGRVFQESPSMWETLSVPRLSAGEGYRFHAHVRRFLLEELPESDTALADWLAQRWVEKGHWLEAKKCEWEAGSAAATS